MKNIFLKQALIYILTSMLMACSDKDGELIPTVPILVDHNVVLSSGINFDNSKTVVFNPLSGEKIKPCKEIATYAGKQQVKRSQKECKINETDIVAPTPVLDAIKNSRKTINGFIKKDEKEIPARFFITVTTLFEGSMCLTHWSGGNEYEDCTFVKEKCNYYVPSFRHRYIDDNVRNTCGIFLGWPDTRIP